MKFGVMDSTLSSIVAGVSRFFLDSTMTDPSDGKPTVVGRELSSGTPGIMSGPPGLDAECVPQEDTTILCEDTILWEDTTAMVIDKPAGLLTQAAGEIDSLERRLREFLCRRLQDRGDLTTQPYFAFAHRLDRPVSGAILVARNVRAARRFGAQFQSRKIGKTYWALCSPVPTEDTGQWRDWLRKIPEVARGEVVAEGHPEGKEAILRYQVLSRFVDHRGESCGLVEVDLETGRMHQIRLQFADRGFPLLGDITYGASSTFGPAVDDPRNAMIALHSRSIEFHHPTTGIRRQVIARLPAAWHELVPAACQERDSQADRGGDD